MLPPSLHLKKTVLIFRHQAHAKVFFVEQQTLCHSVVKTPRQNDIHWGKLMEHICIKIYVFLCIHIHFIFNESMC